MANPYVGCWVKYLGKAYQINKIEAEGEYVYSGKGTDTKVFNMSSTYEYVAKLMNRDEWLDYFWPLVASELKAGKFYLWLNKDGETGLHKSIYPCNWTEGARFREIEIPPTQFVEPPVELSDEEVVKAKWPSAAIFKNVCNNYSVVVQRDGYFYEVVIKTCAHSTPALAWSAAAKVARGE